MMQPDKTIHSVNTSDFILAQTSRRSLPRIDQFAEHLANGLTIPQIRDVMGLNNNQAQGFMNRIRKALGSQAI